MSKIPLTVFPPIFCAPTLFFFSKSLSNWVNNKLTTLTGHKNRPIQIQHLLNIYADFKTQEFLCLLIYEFMNFACAETHLYVPDKRGRFTKMTFTVKKRQGRCEWKGCAPSLLVVSVWHLLTRADSWGQASAPFHVAVTALHHNET